MGNISSDLQNAREANLLMLLVRYWGHILDAADNLSTKSGKLARTPSLNSIATQESKISRKTQHTLPDSDDDAFDWRENTKEELEERKANVPWKDFESSWGSVRSPKMRRRFRKRRKKAQVSQAMWTLSERGDCCDKSGKMFWKTRKPAIADNNMLWRAFHDAETQSQDSGIFNENSVIKSEIIEIGQIETMGRKTRLSNWNFLRQGSPPQRREGRLVRKVSVHRGVRKVRGKGWIQSPLRRVEAREEFSLEEDCSCCSCERCTRGNDMAPNSEEPLAKEWRNHIANKEPQRPPVYNPEDYAQSLKKWGKKDGRMQIALSPTQSTISLDSIGSSASKSPKIPSNTKSSSVISGGKKENRKPQLSVAPEGEMSLRQFSSVTELLGKLKTDLQLSFPSFVQEFVGDPVDGVTLLLELLRTVQLSQQQQQQRCPPQVQRRALLDEHSCLICLQHCLRCTDAARRLAASPAGLFTLAVCIMSNVTKSRVLALELLTKACEPPANGHGAVSDALSTLRLRYGEPVRFRFLIGMLNSAGAVELLVAGMKFINAFLESSPSVQQRVYIQAELEQAGFAADVLRKTLPSHSEGVKTEIGRFERNFIDVAALQKQANEIGPLKEKLHILERKVQILQEEKGVLRSLEQCLKERCTELEEEMSSQTSAKQPYIAEKGESTPAEDEGISSSEQELSQDDEPKRQPLQEPKKPPRRFLPPFDEPVKLRHDAEEDTTIDQVIEELHNIAKEVDTKTYLRKNVPEDRTRTFVRSKPVRIVEEAEIVPSVILPQPPRRAKSLVHIFLPGRECDDKAVFFESDSESSDSLLSRRKGSFDGLNSPKLARSTYDKVKEWRNKTPEEIRNGTQARPYQERNIDEETIRRKNIVPPPPAFIEKHHSPFIRRTQRFVPVPVKRSQTFHTPETPKPKPKMGVSGLDAKKENRNRYNRKLKDRASPENETKIRSASLDRVDSVVFTEESPRKEIRNIGPRNRRSLAESSLFTPPQPKQRLSRQSSSSTPLTLPVEIIPPGGTRAPPDGSSSPSESKDDPIYATPNKPSKLQKFFGNPKFEGESKENYFENNYACLQPKNVVKALLQPLPETNAPNFHLGPYQSRANFPPTFIRRGNNNAGIYSGSRQSPTPTEASSGSGKQSAVSRTTARLSDSASGLY